jgi:hypothetical protein
LALAPIYFKQIISPITLSVSTDNHSLSQFPSEVPNSMEEGQTWRMNFFDDELEKIVTELPGEEVWL